MDILRELIGEHNKFTLDNTSGSQSSRIGKVVLDLGIVVDDTRTTGAGNLVISLILQSGPIKLDELEFGLEDGTTRSIIGQLKVELKELVRELVSPDRLAIAIEDSDIVKAESATRKNISDLVTTVVDLLDLDKVLTTIVRVLTEEEDKILKAALKRGKDGGDLLRGRGESTVLKVLPAGRERLSMDILGLRELVHSLLSGTIKSDTDEAGFELSHGDKRGVSVDVDIESTSIDLLALLREQRGADLGVDTEDDLLAIVVDVDRAVPERMIGHTKRITTRAVARDKAAETSILAIISRQTSDGSSGSSQTRDNRAGSSSSLGHELRGDTSHSIVDKTETELELTALILDRLGPGDFVVREAVDLFVGADLVLGSATHVKPEVVGIVGLNGATANLELNTVELIGSRDNTGIVGQRGVLDSPREVDIGTEIEDGIIHLEKREVDVEVALEDAIEGGDDRLTGDSLLAIE